MAERIFDALGAPGGVARGRGAVSNRSGRFERLAHEAFDDGWGDDPADEESEPAEARVATRLLVDRARKAITRNTSPDVPFTCSINPYQGCEHGCIYCFARPTHAYLGLSSGLDFETRIFHKPGLADLLARELSARSYRPQMIAMGANTDPYQPAERRLELTRGVLKVLQAFRNPVGIVTKSKLITRDIDILGPMSAAGQAAAFVSITTLDADLARVMEPRAASPRDRLATIRRLSEAGIRTSVLASPMIPGLNDHELEGILSAAAEAGAVGAGTALLRLPAEIAGLFEEWLAAHRPARKDRVLSLMRQCRGGRLYTAEFGARMRGVGPVADLIAARFEAGCRRFGLDRRRWDLDITAFRVPPRSGDQLALFG